MDGLFEPLDRLYARLPELAWQLESLFRVFPSGSFPRGLFNTSLEMTPHVCIEEIKKDIQNLTAQQNNARSAHFLAERIRQKVAVLVKMCQLHRETAAAGAAKNGLEMLTTRQQWVQTVQQEVARLTAQQKAMEKALQSFRDRNDTVAFLTLQKELGEVQRLLTIAQETLASR